MDHVEILITEPQEVTLNLDSPIPCCPWCDEALSGIVINGLHAECNEKLAAEMAEVWDDNAQEIDDEQFSCPTPD